MDRKDVSISFSLRFSLFIHFASFFFYCILLVFFFVHCLCVFFGAGVV